MPTYSLSRTGRMYVAKQTVPTEIRNTSGTASLAAADACKHKTFDITIDPGRIPAFDKEDTADLGWVDRSRPGGKKPASFTCSMGLRGGAAADAEPDCGALLECLFGAKAINTGVSVVYSLNPSNVGQACEIWGFDVPSAVTQWCAFGCIPNTATFELGPVNPSVTFGGPAYWGLSNDQFAAASTEEKGGLTTFPTEPSTQTYTGNPVSVAGSITVNTVTHTDIRNVKIGLDMGRAYDPDIFGAVYGTAPYEDVPTITLDFTIKSSDLSSLVTLRQNMLAYTDMDATVVIGGVAGAIYTFALKRLRFPFVAKIDESQRLKALTVTGCRAQMNASGARDEITLTRT